MFPQPQVKHNLTSHPVRSHSCSSHRLANHRTTTSCLRPRKRTSSSRRGCINGPWRISTCVCCKSMVNCPTRLLRKLDLNCLGGGRDCKSYFTLLLCICLNGNGFAAPTSLSFLRGAFYSILDLYHDIEDGGRLPNHTVQSREDCENGI